MSRVSPGLQQLFAAFTTNPAYADAGITIGAGDSVEGQEDVAITIPKNRARIFIVRASSDESE